MDFIAIDFETANRWRQSACSIGIAVVEGGKVVKSIHRLMKPDPNYYEGINVSIHGITASDTDNEPTFKEQWDDIKPYLDGRVVVAHNASFDMSVLRKLCEHYDLEFPNVKYYCTMLMSRRLFPDMFNHKLSTVSDHLGIELEHHHAESDAIASARIMQHFIESDLNINCFQSLEKELYVKAGEVFAKGYKAFKSNTTPKKRVAKRL